MTAKEFVITAVAVLGSLVMIAAQILALVIHVWTIVIAYLVSGLPAAVISLVLPVLAEIYWFFRVGFNVGFGATYCIAIMAYVGFFGIWFILVSGAIAASER